MPSTNGYERLFEIDQEASVADDSADSVDRGRNVSIASSPRYEANQTPKVDFQPSSLPYFPPRSVPRRQRERSSSIASTLGKWGRDLHTHYRKLRYKHPSPKSNEIYYSVFKSTGDITPFEIPPDGLNYGGPDHTSQAQYDDTVHEAAFAIRDGIEPRLIAEGSSGSYFMYNRAQKVVGVFKPKDEEPYGPLSPKWTKWLHRNLFPCFFGRSCLIPNNGYICEAAASVLDRQLQTFIVPFTDTVSFSSPEFYYSYLDKRRFNKGTALPHKVGSFQLFLHDYVQANVFFRQYPLPGTVGYADDGEHLISDQFNHRAFRWTSEVLRQFREELEKLVILDYIMRNTDRGLDNWMIGIEWQASGRPRLKIGAIDNGLAFPWKHPEWRSYPFGWLFLPLSIIGQPFSEKTRRHFISILSSKRWWEECSLILRQMFSRDAEFKERLWKRQWALLKGQAFNVIQTLKEPDQGPLELARRCRVMVWDDEMEIPVKLRHEVSNAINTPMSIPYRDNEDEENSIETASVGRLSSFPTLDVLGNSSRGSPRLPEIQEITVTHGPDDLDSDSTELIDVVGFSQVEEEANDEHRGSRLVIVERIQTITSRPPIFTWC